MYAGKIASPDAIIENRTFDEIAVGEKASLSRTVTQEDIDLFAIVSGDVNPAHMDPAYAKTDIFHRVIAHGMLGAGLISNVLGTKLPGPGTIYMGQDLRFLRPVDIGDTITATLTVTEKHPEKGDLLLDCHCSNQKGQEVISGTAHVRAPRDKVRVSRVELPEVRLTRHARFNALFAEAAAQPPLATAIAHPCDANALGAAVEAANAASSCRYSSDQRRRFRRRPRTPKSIFHPFGSLMPPTAMRRPRQPSRSCAQARRRF